MMALDGGCGHGARGRSARNTSSGGGSGAASGADGSDTPAERSVTGFLRQHRIGRFNLQLQQLEHTSMARQLTLKNVNNLADSMAKHSFMENSTLSVIFTGFSGDREPLTDDAADKLKAVLLDGESHSSQQLSCLRTQLARNTIHHLSTTTTKRTNNHRETAARSSSSVVCCCACSSSSSSISTPRLMMNGRTALPRCER